MNSTRKMQGKRYKGKGPLYLVPFIFALLLSACGFHLRGPVVLPEVMAKTELRGVAPHGDLANEIESVLAEAGARVVESGEGAGAILEITGERFDRGVASVDSTGKASQYQLHYSLNGLLRNAEGEALTPDRGAVAQRLLNVDSASALGTSSEEETLRHDMQRDAVRQLIRQLRTSLLREPAMKKKATQ